MIFAGDEIPNLYIRFKNSDNKWGNPINMGNIINTAEDERFPVVTPDGKYLFFIRGEGYLNDYYWMSTSIIDDLRSEANKYLGQTPPGNSAEIFAPGIISKENSHCRLVISPDEKEIFWNIADFNTWESIIYCATYSNGKWSDPFIPSFATAGLTSNVVYSPDGKKLFFEYRDNTSSSFTFKYVEKVDTGWSEQMSDGFLINTSSSFTSTGKVYYSDSYANTPWGGGVYSADYSETGFSNIQLLPESINTTDIINYTPYIAPDESYLLFSSNRPVTGGIDDNMHIYISFNDGGIWSTPQEINDAINFSGKATHPSISPDGKYLFFCGDDHNFYWVDIEALEQLRPTAIHTFNRSSDISIFPNPGNGLMNVSFSKTTQQATIEIYNLLCALVFSKTFHNTISETIDLTGNSAGIYVVRAFVDGELLNKKICIE
jgi:dipeptidyl aminopeptidase/acylaminoacyl peptidase